MKVVSKPIDVIAYCNKHGDIEPIKLRVDNKVIKVERILAREIEKLCKTDIRFMWLLQDNDAPSFMTIDNFMNHCLSESIGDIFIEINKYIFEHLLHSRLRECNSERTPSTH